MKVSYDWLQTYFNEKLPSPEELAELLTFHAFEIEGIEQVGKDHVIDIDVLPNRASDCLCHRGIAREIATLLNRKLKDDPLQQDVLSTPVSKLLRVEVLSPELCNRFSALVVGGVKVGPSPKWLVDRLQSIGQKSINNIVDVMNYVMFDIGQPLHAFDRDKLTSKNGSYGITVRTGKGDEKIVTLDGGEHTLGKENLLIVDGNDDKAIGIAGVKGGKRAEVDKNTTNLIIEAANFNYVSVRKTSQKLKLITDASSRFQNEPSPELTLHALREVERELQNIGAGGKLEGYVDVYPKQRKPYKVGVSLSEVNKLLGANISEKEIRGIFERFGFVYEKVDPVKNIAALASQLVGKPYRYGASVSYDAPDEFDCSGFVTYLFREAGVSIPRISVDQFVYGEEVNEDKLKPGDVIFSRTTDDDDTETFTLIADGKEVTQHTLHHESLNFMPGTKVPKGISHNGIYLGDGKVAHAAWNGGNGAVVVELLRESKKFENIVGYRRMLLGDEERFVVTVPFERKDLKIKEDLIEEIGRVYGYKNIKSEPLPKATGTSTVNKQFYYAEKVRRLLVEHGFSEVMTYALRDEGEVEIENPLASDKAFLRSNLSDGVTAALQSNYKNVALLGLKDIRVFEIGKVFKKEGEHTVLCIGQGAQVEPTLNDIHAELQEVLGVTFKGVASSPETIEFNFDELAELLPQPKTYDTPVYWSQGVTFKSISQYPFVLRDISVWVPGTVKSEEVVTLIRKKAGNMLVNSHLFDEYKKDDRVSYAFNLVFQSQEKTLSDGEVNRIMGRISNAFSEHAWEIR